MKQTTLSPAASVDDDEIEVSKILLDLRNLFRLSDKCGSCLTELLRSALRWGRKRRRSDGGSCWLVSPTTMSRAEVNSEFVSPPPKDSHAGPKVLSEELSPATPLAFSPSESDEKPVNNSSRKHSKKRTREEWMRNIDELTQCREMLIEQLKNVRAYYDNQKAYNLKLKAMKQQLQGTMQTQEKRSMTAFGPHTNAAQQYHPMGQRFQYQIVQNGPMRALLSSQNGLGPMNYRLGPIGIPDLNVTVDESMGTMAAGSSQPFDDQRMEGDKKATYAEARRSRMIIRNKMKIKSGSRDITIPSRR